LNLPFYIARRYLFAKKSHNAINIISLVSVSGVMVATVAMICTLSVFNGFKGLTTTLFSVFDPELKITSVSGKVFNPDTPTFDALRGMPEILLCSETLQENALVRYGDRQNVTVIKGVDSCYRHIAMIDTAIIDGSYRLAEEDAEYGVLGLGLAYTLGVNAAFARPMEIFMPKRNETVNLANPAASSRVEYVFIGGVYQINQQSYDEGFMLVSLDLLRSMLEYDREVSALEIKTAPGVNPTALKKKISALIGDGYAVKDRFEQQEATFKMVQIEKWVTFLMMVFILVMALFNVLGSLAILMIEKEEDVAKLRSMGADNTLINRLFLYEGWMISLFGAFTGVAVGLALCFVQQRFGLISLGDSAGAFIIDAYPVRVEFSDVLLVFLTVVGLGFLAALYPVHFLGKKWIGVANFLTLSLLLFSCNNASKRADSAEIAVTIEPVRYFAEHIARDDYSFFSVVPAGQGPETYDPSPREIVRFSRAAAFLHLGLLPTEIKLSSIARTSFNLSENMHFADMSGDAHTDPHIWTSFGGARLIASGICSALSSLNPSRSAFYKSNCDSLLQSITVLEAAMHASLDTLSCRSFVIYHPALTYFAEEFHLRQLSIEADGKEPSPASLKRLTEEARHDRVKVIFVQKEFDARYAAQLALETDARIEPVNTLDYQWDKAMNAIAAALIAK